MKIRDLIASLQAFDPDKDVIVATDDGSMTQLEDVLEISDNGGHAQLNAESFIAALIARNVHAEARIRKALSNGSASERVLARRTGLTPETLARALETMPGVEVARRYKTSTHWRLIPQSRRPA